jgi:hypothetical protein
MNGFTSHMTKETSPHKGEAFRAAIAEERFRLEETAQRDNAPPALHPRQILYKERSG